MSILELFFDIFYDLYIKIPSLVCGPFQIFHENVYFQRNMHISWTNIKYINNVSKIYPNLSYMSLFSVAWTPHMYILKNMTPARNPKQSSCAIRSI